MGSVGAKQSGLSDEFNGYFGERYEEDAIERLTWANNDNIINPNYAQSTLYRKNCALCATAVPLLARGYDIEAMPRDVDQWRGFNSIFDVDYSNPNNYMLSGSTYNMMGMPSKLRISHDPNYNIKENDIPTAPRGSQRVAQAVIDKAKKWGNGGIGVMNVKWKDANSAHAVNIINQNGNVFIYDSQSNRVIHDIPKYLSRTVANHTTLVRLDNASVKKNIDNETLSKMFKKSSRTRKRKNSLSDAMKIIDNMNF